MRDEETGVKNMIPLIMYIIIGMLIIAVVGLLIALIVVLRKRSKLRNRCAICGYRLEKTQLQCPHCGNRRLINEGDIPGYK